MYLSGNTNRHDNKPRSIGGFTLLEMIVVMGVLGLIASVIIAAIKPAKYFASARNIQRRADIERIQGALNQYSIERDGSLPPTVSTTLQMIGIATNNCNVSCGNASTSQTCTNLGTSITPTYIDLMPIDSVSGNANRTFYAVQKLTAGGPGLLIRACAAELGQVIEIKQ